MVHKVGVEPKAGIPDLSLYREGFVLFFKKDFCYIIVYGGGFSLRLHPHHQEY
jgi:hypothetical protein